MPNICYIERKFRPDAVLRIKQANEIIAEYEAQGFKLTLRQLYYQFVSRDLISNTVQSYKNLGSIVNDARLAGLIDWDAIEDRTRNLRSLSTWQNPTEILNAVSRQYREDLWAKQADYCEVWIEKDALVGIIEGVCEEYRVPFFACRGYTSQSEMWGAAQRLIEIECGDNNTGRSRQTHIIHLGDHDPSGIDMSRDIQERLRLFESEAEVHRIALTFEQVQQYSPPPNPAKATDARYADYESKYGDESWELDALEPRVIVALIREAIKARINGPKWRASLAAEQAERKRLSHVASNWKQITKKVEV